MNRLLPAALLATALLAACDPAVDTSADPAADGSSGAGASLLRDFVRDGKYDDAGHPANARVTDAETLCRGVGTKLPHSWVVTTVGDACKGTLAGSVQQGEMILNLRLTARPTDLTRDVLTVDIARGATHLAHATLAGSAVRSGWMNFPVAYTQDASAPLTVTVHSDGNGRVEIDYLEIFPAAFQIVIGPGSSEVADGDFITIESGLGSMLEVAANGLDVSDQLTHLLSSGAATVDVTGFRRLVHVRAGDLLRGIPGDAELLVREGGNTSRMELRRAAPACAFEGDARGKKVLITGFQPFPADATHENVSGVAVRSLDPSALSGVQVMRLVLPVEYDRAPAEVVSAIARCRPDAVVSFGQGGSDIALEHTAYNLKDTSEVAGGAPDNRGVIAAALPIAATGPRTRSTRLPLGAIATALGTVGETFVQSTDPGRYVCNDVFYSEAATTVKAAGFIHLPYTTDFPDDVKAHLGKVVAAVVSTLR